MTRGDFLEYSALLGRSPVSATLEPATFQTRIKGAICVVQTQSKKEGEPCHPFPKNENGKSPGKVQSYKIKGQRPALAALDL